MKPFTLKEIKALLLIFIAVFSVTAYNMNISLRRARDAQRKGDLGIVTDALTKFHSEYGYLPLSENGKIKMCKGSSFNEKLAQASAKEPFDRTLFFEGLRGCEWGKDGLYDLLDPDSEPYMKTLPSDPRTKEGLSYIYLSNINRFQLYSYLEGESDESGYDDSVVARNLKCGSDICSFGKSFNVPIDRDIEEYEAELIKNSSGNR